MNETFHPAAADFDFHGFQRAFGMLHDQTLTDFSVKADTVVLTFGDYRIFQNDFADTEVYAQYKDFRSCRVEILLDPDVPPAEQTVRLEKVGRSGTFKGKTTPLSTFADVLSKTVFLDAALSDTLLLHFALYDAAYDSAALYLQATAVSFQWA